MITTKLTIEKINDDILKLGMYSPKPTDNHFEISYFNSDISDIANWFTLWDITEDNEFIIAGNYVKFHINNELLTSDVLLYKYLV